MFYCSNCKGLLKTEKGKNTCAACKKPLLRTPETERLTKVYLCLARPDDSFEDARQNRRLWFIDHRKMLLETIKDLEALEKGLKDPKNKKMARESTGAFKRQVKMIGNFLKHKEEKIVKYEEI